MQLKLCHCPARKTPYHSHAYLAWLYETKLKKKRQNISKIKNWGKKRCKTVYNWNNLTLVNSSLQHRTWWPEDTQVSVYPRRLRLDYPYIAWVCKTNLTATRASLLASECCLLKTSASYKGCSTAQGTESFQPVLTDSLQTTDSLSG